MKNESQWLIDFPTLSHVTIIPSHWKICRLKHAINEFIGGGTPESGNDEFWTDLESGIAWVAIGDMTREPIVRFTDKKLTTKGVNEKKLAILPKGTLLYSMYASLGEVAELGIEACTNQAILGLIPSQLIFKNFLKYWLISLKSGLFVFSSSNTQDNLNLEKVRNLPLLLPQLEQQYAIADYLDRETIRLDSLIAAKERLLELLAEKRRAVITHAVTRGVNPKVSLRDSGVEWLGEIPSHWEVEYARWLFNEIDERSTEHGEEEMLTVSHITGVTARAEKEVNMFLAESNEGYKICRRGDLVINTLWAWMGAMGIAFQDGIVSPAYNVYRLREKYTPEYIDLLVRMPVFAQEVIRFSKGVWSSRLRLYPEEFFKVQMPVPPISEQKEIVIFIKDIIEKIDRLAVLATKTIEHLHERRASLIAAVVSGQIRVV